MHELHKILGQMELLGSPILLTSSLLAGVASFFAEPAKARSPGEFAHGVGQGTLALLRSAAFGLCNALGQVSRPVLRSCMLKTIQQSAVQDAACVWLHNFR